MTQVNGYFVRLEMWRHLGGVEDRTFTVEVHLPSTIMSLDQAQKMAEEIVERCRKAIWEAR
jgi:hypothetical protein